MKILILLTALCGFVVQAQEFKPVAKSKDQVVDDLIPMKGPSLNAGDRFEVASFDPKTQTYKLVLRADPSAGPLITTAENLARAVENIDLKKVSKAPYSIVRFDYSVAEDKSLDLLVEDEVNARAKATRAAAAKGPENAP